MQTIDGLVSELRENYFIDGKIKYKQILSDNYIMFTRDSRVFYYGSGRDNKKFIHLGYTPFHDFNKYVFWHELGHVLLKTSSEAEADYFADQFAQKNYLSFLGAAAYRWVKNPVNMLKFVLRPNAYSRNIMKKIYEEKKSQKIR